MSEGSIIHNTQRTNWTNLDRTGSEIMRAFIGIYVWAPHLHTCMYKINKIKREREKRQSLKQFLSRAVTHA